MVCVFWGEAWRGLGFGATGKQAGELVVQPSGDHTEESFLAAAVVDRFDEEVGEGMVFFGHGELLLYGL